MSKKQVLVSFSPALFEHYYIQESIIVIIDAIRMSATITTAIANGAKEIVPVASLDETINYREKGYLVAGERNSDKVEGFDFGNSPYEFIRKKVEGKKIAISTTNGTQVIDLIKRKTGDKSPILIGTFLNISFLANYLVKQNKHIIIQCSGWKNTVSVEDILFAGFLAEKLLDKAEHYFWRDSAFLAQQLYSQAKNNLIDYVYSNSPRLASRKAVLDKDIRYCFEIDKFNIIPELQVNKIVALKI